VSWLAVGVVILIALKLSGRPAALIESDATTPRSD
jgi:hypothetical protein